MKTKPKVGAMYRVGRVSDGAAGLRRVVEDYREEANRDPVAVYLHSEAEGKTVGEIIAAAEEMGLEVRRASGILSWEVWVGE